MKIINSLIAFLSSLKGFVLGERTYYMVEVRFTDSNDTATIAVASQVGQKTFPLEQFNKKMINDLEKMGYRNSPENFTILSTRTLTKAEYSNADTIEIYQ